MDDAVEPGDQQPTLHNAWTRSEMSGSAENVVQARDVSGGIHFHTPSPSAGPKPRQLPADVRGFVNRDTELTRLSSMLFRRAADDGTVAVIVVTGTAGVGKTSLIIHWAHQMQERFADGQLYVNLRGYDAGEPVTAAEALHRFLRALGVPVSDIPADEPSRAALFRSLMAERRTLIVLDNAATVGQVRPLLPGTSTSLTLVSSRNRLSGLGAQDGAARVELAPFTERESITLLRHVTAEYRPADDPRDLAKLSRLCGHLPLALRIAAERAAVRPHMLLRDLIGDLQDESALWDALSTEVDEAADAVRTVFAWSYRALSADTARLFRLLGLHPGPEFSAAAAAALADAPPAQTRRLLDGLVGVHLLEQVGHDKYQFHDLLYAYASDQAHHEEPPAEQRSALERLAEWYLRSAVAAVQASFPTHELPRVPLDGFATDSPPPFADYDAAIGWYDAERENLIAIARAAASTGLDEIAWRIPGVLRPIYGTRDPVDAWLPTEQLALSAARRCGNRYGEALLQLWSGISHRFLGELAAAAESYEAAWAGFGELGQPQGQLQAVNGLGLVHMRARELALARVNFEHTVEIARRSDDSVWIALALINLGYVLTRLGSLAEAVTCLSEASDRLHSSSARLYESEALTNLAAVHRRMGLRTEAHRLIQEALSIAREHRNPAHEASALIELAQLQLTDGMAVEALVSAQQAAAQCRKRADRSGEATAWNLIGESYRDQGRLDEAIAFHQQAAAVHGDLGERWLRGLDLESLGTALLDAGRSAQARVQWTASLEAISGFTDPEAAALRARIRLALRSADRRGHGG
jgi:tetratricopeptide (TPR) repeat protein